MSIELQGRGIASRVTFRLWPIIAMKRGPLRHWGLCLVKNTTPEVSAEELWRRTHSEQCVEHEAHTAHKWRTPWSEYWCGGLK